MEGSVAAITTMVDVVEASIGASFPGQFSIHVVVITFSTLPAELG